jgi:hypothetical protein
MGSEDLVNAPKADGADGGPKSRLFFVAKIASSEGEKMSAGYKG